MMVYEKQFMFQDGPHFKKVTNSFFIIIIIYFWGGEGLSILCLLISWASSSSHL